MAKPKRRNPASDQTERGSYCKEQPVDDTPARVPRLILSRWFSPDAALRFLFVDQGGRHAISPERLLRPAGERDRSNECAKSTVGRLRESGG